MTKASCNKHLFNTVLAFFMVSLFSFSASAAAPKILTVQHKHDIKVVYDVDQDKKEAGIGQALYYVRGLLEAYKGQGVPLKQLHISVVVHGAAGYWLLKDDPYQKHVGDPFAVNMNAKVVKELIDMGVSVEMCHVTMKAYHWTAKDLLPGVKIVYDAYTRMIDLQMQGYAYIKFVE